MEHLQHLALMDLGSQEAYGTTGESHCLCGPAPPQITDRVEPMVSVLEDRCLHLGSNNVVECTEELLQISTLSYGGVFCASLPIPTLHPGRFNTKHALLIFCGYQNQLQKKVYDMGQRGEKRLHVEEKLVLSMIVEDCKCPSTQLELSNEQNSEGFAFGGSLHDTEVRDTDINDGGDRKGKSKAVEQGSETQGLTGNKKRLQVNLPGSTTQYRTHFSKHDHPLATTNKQPHVPVDDDDDDDDDDDGSWLNNTPLALVLKLQLDSGFLEVKEYAQ
eukprot:bmy_15171T0